MNILIVEDDECLQLLYGKKLAEKSPSLFILKATTYEEAYQLIEQKQFDIAVFDGSLGKGIFETVPLVEKLIKSNFKGPIIANSNNEESMDALRKAGCTDRSESKEKCPAKIIEAVHRFILTRTP